MKYQIIIYWSQADEAFIAEVPELPSCAADGRTYKQALANVEIIIQEWIETAKELGRPIPARVAASPSLNQALHAHNGSIDRENVPSVPTPPHDYTYSVPYSHVYPAFQVLANDLKE